MVMAGETETRAVTLVDLPAVRRLVSQAMVLDSAIEYTQAVYEPTTSTLTNLLLPQRSLHTLIAKSDQQQVVGQFRLRGEDQNAHLVYIAPGPDNDCEDTEWLHILDTMVREAGQHNAHSLIAEVREDSRLFETMRQSGFAVYSRRQIWQRPSDAPPLPDDLEVEVVPESDADRLAVQSLIAQIVPPLMQPFVMPNGDMDGWIYRRDGQITAFIGATSGKLGIYLMPFVHPDVMNDTDAIISSLLRQMPKADKLRVSVCVSRYLDWIGTSLEALHFEPGARQAVMVRHITAGVRQASFKPVEARQAAVAGSADTPTLFAWFARGLVHIMNFLLGVKAKLKERLWKDMLLTI